MLRDIHRNKTSREADTDRGREIYKEQHTTQRPTNRRRRRHTYKEGQTFLERQKQRHREGETHRHTHTYAQTGSPVHRWTQKDTHTQT